jgi:putative restriction endonuclease
MKGVFVCNPNSAYDDNLIERYHFRHSHYLDLARSMVGDWIVYQEPRRGGGREAYIAAARVASIEQDPLRLNYYYARLRDFLPFDQPVKFRRENLYRESPLNALERQRVGPHLQGRSVRALSEEDFAAIVLDGLQETLSPENARRLNLDLGDLPTQDFPTVGGIAERDFGWDPGNRVVAQVLVNRKLRDAAFRRSVVDAYDNTCAVSGLRIVNGGGRAEVQAAHIWPVGEGGPDVVQNGIALSATAHWLFDRHMISLTDNYELLVSHNKVPSELRRLFADQMERIRLPSDERMWPHIPYVRLHRERYVAG